MDGQPLTRYSQTERENAARGAARTLARHGISDLDGRFLSDLGRTGASAVAWLADIAARIDSLDPMEIAAGALLEAQGYQRANVQLTLELDAGTSSAVTGESLDRAPSPSQTGEEMGRNAVVRVQ